MKTLRQTVNLVSASGNRKDAVIVAKLQTALFDCIGKRDIEGIVYCLSQGANVNAREVVVVKPSPDRRRFPDETAEGDTPLTAALRMVPKGEYEEKFDKARQEAVVEFLIERGADVNHADQYDISPLQLALLRDCSLRLIRLLLARGAKVNRTHRYLSPPLSWAIAQRRTEVVGLFLKQGAYVEGAPLNSGRTPLMDASDAGSVEIVALLLKAGANPNRRFFGRTVLERILSFGVSGSGMDTQENQKIRDKVMDLLRHAGGIARTSEELKALREDEFKSSEEGIRQRNAARQALGERYRRERIVTTDDARVVEEVLLDLLLYQGRDLQLDTDPKAPYIQVVPETAEIDHWLRMEPSLLTAAQERDLTPEMLERLRGRNVEAVSMARLAFKDRRIRLFKSTRTDISDEPFEKRYPDVRARVGVSLPGYNDIRDRALVMYWLVPAGGHLYSGASFLTRYTGTGISSKGVWCVKWRDFHHML